MTVRNRFRLVAGLCAAFLLPAGAFCTDSPAPAIPGSASDPQATKLADAVMQSLGGSAAWDSAPLIFSPATRPRSGDRLRSSSSCCNQSRGARSRRWLLK